MLKDMKAELEKELADDEEVHELLSCWCKTNDEEKSKAKPGSLDWALPQEGPPQR